MFCPQPPYIRKVGPNKPANPETAARPPRRSLRPPGKKSLRPAPRSASVPPTTDIDSAWDEEAAGIPGSETPIEVSPDWLENEFPESRAGKAAVGAPAAAPMACVGEAVRVWVGPNGELELLNPTSRAPVGYVEAILVASSSTAGLMERLRRR